jgi:hypothetical protein
MSSRNEILAKQWFTAQGMRLVRDRLEKWAIDEDDAGYGYVVLRGFHGIEDEEDIGAFTGGSGDPFDIIPDEVDWARAEKEYDQLAPRAARQAVELWRGQRRP